MQNSECRMQNRGNTFVRHSAFCILSSALVVTSPLATDSKQCFVWLAAGELLRDVVFLIGLVLAVKRGKDERSVVVDHGGGADGVEVPPLVIVPAELAKLDHRLRAVTPRRRKIGTRRLVPKLAAEKIHE